MTNEIIMAGFGGQGVLLIGKLLAYAGMKSGQEVTWMPSYGPEMRGGTCNCTVVLSDRQVGSPISKHPHGLIVLNLPSLDKFEASVRPGGTIVVNTSLVNRMPTRTDVTAVPVPGNEIAQEEGNGKATNMVALGAFLGATKLAAMEVVTKVLSESMAARPKLIPVNLRCLERGFEIGRKHAAAAAK